MIQTDKDIIDNILKEKKETINKKNTAIDCLRCLDLTSLNSEDNESSIRRFIENSKIKELENVKVAGLCVYPNFLPLMNDTLKDKDIKKVVVAGYFPFGQNPTKLKLNEIKFAVDNGAQEVDIVMNRGLFLEGKFDEVSQETFLAKQICKEIILKVILETGELNSLENVYKASLINLEAGADFIKTSTGKSSKGADIYSFATMLKAIKDYEHQTKTLKSIKAAGGIVTAHNAIEYHILFSHFIGNQNLNPKYFRIGGSRLKNNLINFVLNN